MKIICIILDFFLLKKKLAARTAAVTVQFFYIFVFTIKKNY
ncbi:protein of unknown function [Xenorhabdus doucetiae]|uniref:Uncharacterized protein n=1 Tax=Xenorhabdus doucetiae TaxID=351671 RepID=A0A068QMD0_9GAMM|nr:protein of unknown function [Xenorhabdus doucetiae]